MCFPFEQRLFVWLCNSCLSVCGCGGWGGMEMGAWVYGHNPKHFLVHFFLTTRSTGTQFSVLLQPLLFKPVTSICWPVIMSKACQHHTHAHSHTQSSMNLWADRCLNVDSTGETVALAVSSHPSCSADPSSHQINSSTFVQSHPSTLPPFTLVPTSCCGQKKKKNTPFVTVTRPLICQEWGPTCHQCRPHTHRAALGQQQLQGQVNWQHRHHGPLPQQENRSTFCQHLKIKKEHQIYPESKSTWIILELFESTLIQLPCYIPGAGETFK